MPLPRPVLVGVAVALSAVVGAGATWSVSRHSDTAVLARTLADLQSAEPAPDPSAPSGDAVDPVAEPSPDPLVAVDAPKDPAQKELEDSWLKDPRGSVPQISLRFVQALQRGDDLAAVHELDREERMWLSLRDLWTLHRVMSDVRKNAGLADAAPCRRVAQISAKAAVVTCGARHVVVNAAPWVGMTGVRLSDWTLHHDVYHGPHTHAYTQMEL